MVQLLSMIEDGNKTCGGLRKVLVAYGIIGNDCLGLTYIEMYLTSDS